MVTTASVTNFDVKKIVCGTAGQVWIGMATPAAGGFPTLHTDGTPDLTTNPNAKHLGMTKEGTTGTFELSKTDYFADEFPFPIKTVIEQVNGRLEGSFLQVLDFVVLEKLTSGFGKVVTPPPTGAQQITFGQVPLVYANVSLIFPTEADPTKFAVLMIYEGLNTGGLTFQVSRKGQAELPFKFEGRAVSGRSQADAFGQLYVQVGP
jgi:hypothetical protein